ncbi:MAG: PD40 domain-containing protein [Bdellovibrionales bacterium]|nr:PD40 domain-containing protein [Bdellovibrionales bacterium]
MATRVRPGTWFRAVIPALLLPAVVACRPLVLGENEEGTGGGSCDDTGIGSGSLVMHSLTALDGSWNGTSSVSSNIWVIDDAGSSGTALTQNTIAGLPSNWGVFSPDGSFVAFYSAMDLAQPVDGTPGDSYNIWTAAAADGSGKLSFTSETVGGLNAVNSWYPSFRPDGLKLVYSSYNALNLSFNTTYAGRNIWHIDSDGTDRAPLTQYPNTTMADCRYPEYTDNGAKIVFQCDGDTAGTWTSLENSDNIWVMDADGNNRTPLTNNTAGAAGVYDSWRPTLSADGTRIVFESKMDLTGADDGTATLSTNIWVMDIDGSNKTALTTNSAAGLDSGIAQFSPDGTKIVFVSRMDVNGQAALSNNVWVMDSDGSDARPITTETSAGRDSMNPTFSDDGKFIAFYSKIDVDGAASLSYNVFTYHLGCELLTPVTRNTSTGLDSFLRASRGIYRR